jgi:hypothetical protein
MTLEQGGGSEEEKSDRGSEGGRVRPEWAPIVGMENAPRLEVGDGLSTGARRAEMFLFSALSRILSSPPFGFFRGVAYPQP